MSDESIIGATTRIRGNVTGSGSLVVEGQVEGDIVMEGDVVLGEGGRVRGSIQGASLRVAGQVAGDLKANDSISVESGARVVGDIIAARIGIAEGALVRGLVQTEGEPAAPRAARSVAAARSVPARAAAPSRAAAPVASRRAQSLPAKTQSSPAKAKAEAKPEPKQEKKPKAAPAKAEAKAETKAAKSRKPPAPVVPAVRRGAQAKKKRRAR